MRREQTLNDSSKRHLLIVDDDRDFADSMFDLLKPLNYELAIANTAHEALDIIKELIVQVALIDIRLGHSNGIELIDQLKDICPGLLCVIMTAYATTDSAIEAFHHGAYDYMRKPIEVHDLIASLNRYYEKIRLEEENAKAIEKLRDSEERYRTLVENVNIGVYRYKGGLSGKLIQTNPTLAKMFGYETVDEFLKISITGLYQDQGDKYIVGDELRNDGFIKNKELQLRKKDGSSIIASCTAKAQHDENGNIMWIDGVIEDITDRKQAEEKLIRIEMAVESSSDAIGISDSTGKHIYHNKSFSDLFEYTPEEIDSLGGGASVYVNKDIANKVFDAIMSGKSWNGEVEMKSRKGHRFPILLRADAIKDDEGNIIGLIGVHTEITDRKKAEAALMESERRFRELADLLPQVVCETDEHGNLAFINRISYDFFGYTASDINKGANIYQMLVPEDRERAKINFEKILHEEEVRGEEYTALRKDGSTFPIILYSSLIIRGNRPEGLRIILIDITGRKRAEESLQKSERSLKEAQRIAHVGSFDWDVINNIVDYSDEIFSLYGLEREEYASENIAAIIDKSIHPDDKKFIKGKISEALAGLNSGPIEYRIVWPGGTVRTLHGESISIRDKKGKTLRVIGTVLDITERKRAEERLKEMSIKDELTGLYNRRGFFTLAEQQLEVASRTNKGMFLFFIDLDNMKWINDTLGHNKGDQALIETANILNNSFRRSDIIARIGGDEFVVIAFEAPAHKTEILTARMDKNFNILNQEPDRPYKLSISAGIAHYNPDYPCTLDNLLALADSQMYEQKRNKVKV